MKYQVIVGNIGTVCDTDDRDEAENLYKYYVDYSIESPHSRCGNESVTMMNGSWIEREHIGTQDIEE